jgi:hypothetical protein
MNFWLNQGLKTVATIQPKVGASDYYLLANFNNFNLAKSVDKVDTKRLKYPSFIRPDLAMAFMN